MSLASFLHTRQPELLRAFLEQQGAGTALGEGPDIDWLLPHLPLVWRELAQALESPTPRALTLEGVGRECTVEAWVAALACVRQALLALLEGEAHPARTRPEELRRMHALLDGLLAHKVSRRMARARAEVSAATHALEGAREETSRGAALQPRPPERDARFLAEATTWLASAQDVPGALVQVAQLAAAQLADWCLVDVVQGEGLVRLAAVHAPGMPEEAGAFRLAPRLSAPHGPGRVARTGIAELVPEVAEAQLRAVAQDAAHLQALQRKGIHSYLSVPMRARGRSLGALTFLRTHSPGRLGERDLQLAEELARSAALALDNARLLSETREAVRARNELLAVVSHDLKNPVHAILMATELLLRAAGDGERGARVRRQTEAIQRASERMRHLIHDLLDAASVEARALNVTCAPQDAEALAREAVELLEPLAQQKAQRLTLCVTQGAGRVGADRERLLQVLGNLLGNALKFTPPGGDIRLEVVPEGPEAVAFRVRDAGPGIAPEDLPHLFDRYWKRASGRDGTGLGLYIARGIVEAHGGTLSVDSRPGEGACFTFTLPRVD